jgi:hypothetical protein
MLSFKSVQMLGLGLITATLLQGCGGASLGDNFKLNLDPATGTARVEVTMSDGLEIALAGNFPVDEYGRISFVPGSRTERAKIVFEYDLERLLAGQLGGYGTVTKLPNEAPLSTPMMPPLVKIPVIQQGSITVDAVLGLIPELQVGAIIGISQFRTQYFPPGVAISQVFRNKDGVAFAVVTLYGPGLNNVPGGVFVGANFGEILDLDNLNPNSIQSLMAASSNRAMMSSVSTQNLLAAANYDEYQEESSDWNESRFDPQGRLSDPRKAHRALQNAKAILRKK